jgi:hypothetical protein
MPKVKEKFGDKIFEVYGAREVTYTERDYDNIYKKRENEFLIWWYGSWSWMDAKDFEPVD